MLRIGQPTCDYTWNSFVTLVLSVWIALEMPKSISFKSPFTMRKFAGFRSAWTIPIKNVRVVNVASIPGPDNLFDLGLLSFLA